MRETSIRDLIVKNLSEELEEKQQEILFIFRLIIN